jgi:hypothetical protein
LQNTLFKKSVKILFPLIFVFTLSSFGVMAQSIISFSSPSRILSSSVNSGDNMLRVSGTSLKTVSGAPVYLRGVQVTWNERMKVQGTSSVASAGQDTWFGADDVARVKDMGGNLIELHIINLREIMPEIHVIDDSFYSNWLDKWVNWCRDNNVYVIINIRGLSCPSDMLSQYGPVMPNWIWEGVYSFPGDSESQANVIHGFYDSENHEMEDKRVAFIEAWESIAARYKDNEYVLFGLINEPLYHTSSYYSDSDATYYGVQYSLLMTRVIDAIRGVGAQQVIFVDRPDVAGVWNVEPISRDNIVWESHGYVNRWWTLQDFKDHIDLVTQRFVQDFNKPLLIGEYGLDPTFLCDEEPWASNWQDILSQMVQHMDSKPLCGRQWHQWDAIDGEYFDYVYDTFNYDESQWILQTVLRS